jgi:hypothetical protein
MLSKQQSSTNSQRQKSQSNDGGSQQSSILRQIKQGFLQLTIGATPRAGSCFEIHSGECLQATDSSIFVVLIFWK